jgi:hypothetical protein
VPRKKGVQLRRDFYGSGWTAGTLFQGGEQFALIGCQAPLDFRIDQKPPERFKFGIIGEDGLGAITKGLLPRIGDDPPAEDLDIDLIKNARGILGISGLHSNAELISQCSHGGRAYFKSAGETAQSDAGAFDVCRFNFVHKCSVVSKLDN